jgi:hypothetical protein
MSDSVPSKASAVWAELRRRIMTSDAWNSATIDVFSVDKLVWREPNHWRRELTFFEGLAQVQSSAYQMLFTKRSNTNQFPCLSHQRSSLG